MTTIKTSNLGFPRLGRKENGKKRLKATGLTKSIRLN